MTERAVHPIEAESYAILRSRVDLTDRPPLTRAVLERVIHASADLSYADDLVCDESALLQAWTALRNGAPIVTDVTMVASGITSRRPTPPEPTAHRPAIPPNPPTPDTPCTPDATAQHPNAPGIPASRPETAAATPGRPQRPGATDQPPNALGTPTRRMHTPSAAAVRAETVSATAEGPGAALGRSDASGNADTEGQPPTSDASGPPAPGPVALSSLPGRTDSANSRRSPRRTGMAGESGHPSACEGPTGTPPASAHGAGGGPAAVRSAGRGVVCRVGDPAAAELAKALGITRSAAAVRLAAEDVGPGAVWVIGCAPTALYEVIAADVRPALVIGLPVGFVGAAESKAALRDSGLPAVSNRGEKGGSAVAAAAVNALLYHEMTGRDT